MQAGGRLDKCWFLSMHLSFSPAHHVMTTIALLGETGVGWDKFWLGQYPSVPNELPDGETNYVFREQLTTAIIGSTRIIDARFASEISPQISFLTTKVDSCLRVSIWAGKVVTRRIAVRVCTRMMQYVWRNLM